jgi:sodium/glucose cotransporter 1
MVAGAIVVAVIGFQKVNGYQNFMATYPYAISSEDAFSNSSCSLPAANSMAILRGVDSDLPWPGVLFGLTIISVWYFCTDQVIVQRALAAKNMTHLKLGVLVCGYLKILPLFIMIMPGMISKVLYPGTHLFFFVIYVETNDFYVFQRRLDVRIRKNVLNIVKVVRVS